MQHGTARWEKGAGDDGTDPPLEYAWDVGLKGPPCSSKTIQVAREELETRKFRDSKAHSHDYPDTNKLRNATHS